MFDLSVRYFLRRLPRERAHIRPRERRRRFCSCSITYHQLMTSIDAPSSAPMMVRRTDEAYDRPSLHAELLTLLTSPDAYAAALVLLLSYAASEAVPQHQRGAPRNSSGLLSNVYLDDHEQACPHAHVHPRRARGCYMPCTRLTNTSLERLEPFAYTPHMKKSNDT